MNAILCRQARAGSHRGLAFAEGRDLTITGWTLAHLQGRQLSRTGAEQESLGDVERPKKPVNTELAFSAEGKLLSCRFYVSDGLVHELPPSAKEVRPIHALLCSRASHSKSK